MLTTKRKLVDFLENRQIPTFVAWAWDLSHISKPKRLTAGADAQGKTRLVPSNARLVWFTLIFLTVSTNSLPFKKRNHILLNFRLIVLYNEILPRLLENIAYTFLQYKTYLEISHKVGLYYLFKIIIIRKDLENKLALTNLRTNSATYQICYK